MFSPAVTYRIQFHEHFRFKDFEPLIPYFKELGVDTIYASPIFEALPSSTHGYDVVNPLRINPEIGTEEELIFITKKLKAVGINWLQDIVPNHMSFHPSNLWLMDVLENWEESIYFKFFDLNFPTPLKDKRLMVPFLAETLVEAVEKKAIQLISKEKKLYLAYGEFNWPINQQSVELVTNKEKLTKANLHKRLKAINNNLELITKITDSQHYRLCHWQETEKQINYRRFFTVNSLICLNIQHQEVFDTYHQYIFSLVKKGVFQGLRIDHIDGLYDPKTYLQRLRDAVGNETYIVVEKILGAKEEMPADWPIQGNTGYDFLATANNLFTNKTAEKSFNKLYKKVIHKPLKVAEQVIVKKSDILFEHMQGELDHLYELFINANFVSKKELQAIKPMQLKQAIANLLIYCPIYRFYGNSFPLNESAKQALQQEITAIPKSEEIFPAINLLTTILLDYPKEQNTAYRAKVLDFYLRCMQFSGPLMAKGVEDTLMYTYNRFIGHTEVGDSPAAFGMTTTAFHEKMQERQQNLPLSMNGTSTHDTKRGEDVRARLNVLSDLPQAWKKLVLKLQQHKTSLHLHQNDAYLIYQTLLGAIPLSAQNEAGMEERLMSYIEKALREAKKRSDWASPNEAYEDTAKKFAISLLNENQKNYKLLHGFLEDIADFSIVNSLAQLLLKFTCPGIPDLYQGTELWDLSLVDPDNRRPVDFELRKKWIKEFKKEVDLDKLWADRTSGKIKLWLTQRLSKIRSANQILFEKGSYLSVKVKGTYKKYILAFLRAYQGNFILVVIPLGLAKIAKEKNKSCNEFDWKDTQVILPSNVPLQWENSLTGVSGQKDVINKGIPINQLFDELPFAMLSFKAPESRRGAGILLHISSLPSAFGIGDLGPEAFSFVDFLAASHQKYWQLLPLNPTGKTTSYSPYSASSAVAGNVLLISPEFLADQGLLDEQEVKSYELAFDDTINFDQTETNKRKLLAIAYQNFTELEPAQLHHAFTQYCISEKAWLDDFVLFTALRNHHGQMPWMEWPEKYKTRVPAALTDFSTSKAAEIDELKWQQFIFYRQWVALKAYANKKGIQLIGDLPFYIAHDSADVWANTNYFKLADDFNITGVAGVPPDDLNKEGQLWGMPVFNWEALKKDGYKWWMIRIKENLCLFDSLRLDHFRAFHTYWEVPATEETAINGIWKKGPGADFFRSVCTTFDELPFIVEDLGGDMEGPEKLRDQFNLPGMKVLQFGFGADMPRSEHMPHHYPSNNMVVYTGTHDNNTTVGWYKNEVDKQARQRLSWYAGQKVNKKNVSRVLIKLALASIAKIAIIPMQDVLALDEETRMNTPATTVNNWLWRMDKNAVSKKIVFWLKQQTELFGR